MSDTGAEVFGDGQLGGQLGRAGQRFHRLDADVVILLHRLIDLPHCITQLTSLRNARGWTKPLVPVAPRRLRACGRYAPLMCTGTA